MKILPHRRGRGFLLLEMVLALGVFGMVATGFVVALHRMSAAASYAQSEMRLTRILDSTLDETLSLPVIEEGSETFTMRDSGMELTTTVELLDDMQNEDGEFLQEMFRIEVRARWFHQGEWHERMVETWRYGRMYQQS